MKTAVILGLGVDTQDVIPWLKEQNYEVTILDEKNGDKFKNLDKYDLIVRSPGVNPLRPEFKGLDLTSKTKLFFDNCHAKIIGVTGTKGKGTTATLIYEILKSAGRDVYLGGNIGAGIFDFLPKLTKDSWVVLELSSFQLIDMQKSPHIAVVLMVTSEHLNWHKTIDEYVEAKTNIVAHQTKNDYAVINNDYPNSIKIGRVAKGNVIWVSKNDVTINSKLKGEHNKENIAAAIAVAKILEIPYEDVVLNFKGLEHRLEEVNTINGITFFNDSFSTTPETAIAAIKAFKEPEIVIMGGSSKNSDFSELVEVIKNTKNIKQILLIGVEGERLSKLLKGFKNLKYLKNMKMDEIVKTAYNMATSGDVVVLSPAAASFDMFQNYKDRGKQFKDAVNRL